MPVDIILRINVLQAPKGATFSGCYGIGSVHEEKGALVYIDKKTIISENNLNDTEKKEALKDVIMHELDHAISDYVGLPLSDPDGFCGGESVEPETMVAMTESDWQKFNADLEAEREKVKLLKEALEKTLTLLDDITSTDFYYSHSEVFDLAQDAITKAKGGE